MKRFAIVTASNEKYGDFLADHWYASLIDSVDLKDIDVVVLDYGLSNEQIARMPNAKFVKCKEDGHVVNLRFRDLLKVLDMGYEQIMSTDGGDIIFQDDVSDVFTISPDALRAVVESHGSIRYDRMMIAKFKPEHRESIMALIDDKELINAGVIVGPNEKLRRVCQGFIEMIEDMGSFGPDTVGINYHFYKEGFVPLDHTYNFLLVNYWGEGVRIKDGKIYNRKTGELIKVVHNAGAVSYLRPIIGFGYKSKDMRLNITYYIMRPITKIANRLLRLIPRKLLFLSRKRV